MPGGIIESSKLTCLSSALSRRALTGRAAGVVALAIALTCLAVYGLAS
ncbi:MAG: hypothetical protein ACRDT1_16195 [Micromonosporaceae bacterium]